MVSCCSPLQIERLLQQRDEKENLLVALLKRTATDIWTEELNTFLVEWEVFHLLCSFLTEHTLTFSSQRDCANWVKLHEDNEKRPANKRKQATLKTRKSLGNHDDDSADDFKPSKAAAKQSRKVAAPIAKRPVTTKVEDSDGEANVIPVTKAKRLVAPKPAAIQPDSDIEMLDGSSKKDKGKGKAGTKRKRFVGTDAAIS
jgi:DNA topoisomerase II